MYGLIDCNNFFVSCERVFDPTLNGRAVVVLSNNDGCVIARSNEAKRLGIPMGCPAFQIRDYTDSRDIVALSGRHVLYNDISHRVMSILGEEVENLQIYSVDEAFFTLPYDDVEQNHELMAKIIKRIQKYVGIPVSAGFAPSRTLAKIASHVAKKSKRITDGVYWLVRKEAIDIILRRTDINDVWGIGKRLSADLHSRGIDTAYDFAHLPPAQVRQLFSITVERTLRELRGEDCQVENPVTIAHKSIMSSRTFGHIITDRRQVQDAILSFAEKISRQLRREHSVAGSVVTYVRGDRFRKDLPYYANSCQIKLPCPASDAHTIVHHALLALANIFREGIAYRRAGVIALDINSDTAIQLNVWDNSHPERKRRLMESIDNINDHFDALQVKLAPQLLRGEWSPIRNHEDSKKYALRFYSGMS